MATASNHSGSLPSRILKRGREERLTQAAGGLTFAVMVSLVPLLAVSFALFARVPALRATGEAIREHLLRGLLPADIARTVLKYLAQFTGNAGGLTQLGFALLLVSAFMLLLSVENTLNRIWQVKKPRTVLRRLALCAVLLLAGPVVIGASLWAASYLQALSSGLIGTRPAWLPHALNVGPLLLSIAGFSALFRCVPHTAVRWRDAITGGLLAGVAFELGKHGFAMYLAKVPSYRTIYGAFAPLLAFLVWVYYSWLVTLAAALVSASLPRGKGQAARRTARA
ncbi:MAG: YihY family inner membrane protein [Polaromonas sp.]|uniref:YihY family inner membrane protein n=1 Tax=Polaromonas sp. TaxID=1869339 RepID=UPI004035E290